MSWSSLQVIDKKEQASLQKDLLGLLMTLQKQDSKHMDIMTNTNFGDMTRTTTIKDILENILINQGNA